MSDSKKNQKPYYFFVENQNLLASKSISASAYLAQNPSREFFKICQIWLFVQPAAKKNEWVNIIEGDETTPARFKLKIKAPPIDGKANQELISFLADFLNLPKSAIFLEQGQAGRLKKIIIQKNQKNQKNKEYQDLNIAALEKKLADLYEKLSSQSPKAQGELF